MAGHDDVVVAYGVGEEVGGLLLVVKLNDLLRAAEVGLCLVSDELTLGNEAAAEVT